MDQISQAASTNPAELASLAGLGPAQRPHFSSFLKAGGERVRQRILEVLHRIRCAMENLYLEPSEKFIRVFQIEVVG